MRGFGGLPFLLLALAVVGCGESPPEPPDPEPAPVVRPPSGTIGGRVAFELPGTFAAVVYLEPRPGDPPVRPPAEPAVLGQANDGRRYRFVPGVLPVVVGTTVVIRNTDEYRHNVRGEGLDEDLLPGQEVGRRFDAAGVHFLECALHPRMEAYVVAVGTPWFGATDADGAFEIVGVPPGEWTIVLWHPEAETQRRTVEVVADAVVEVVFEAP